MNGALALFVIALVFAATLKPLVRLAYRIRDKRVWETSKDREFI